MRPLRRELLLLAVFCLAACGRPRVLSSFSGPIDNGYRVLGFGFSEDWQTTNVGDLTYLFVFEPEPSRPEGSSESLRDGGSQYHDAAVIRQSMSFSRKDANGRTIEQRNVDLVIDRKGDHFQVADLTGGPGPGRIVLVGRNNQGKLVIKRQLPPPGPIRFHVDDAKALLAGPLGKSLGIGP